MKRVKLTPGEALNARIILGGTLKHVLHDEFEVTDVEVRRLLNGASAIGDYKLAMAVRAAKEVTP